MLIAAMVCFALAILLGITMLSFIIQGKRPPRFVVFTHGPLALTGIMLLITYAFMSSRGPIVSLTLFIMAALGGLTMFYKDMTGKPVPTAMALGHGILAFVAFIFLVVYLLTA